MNEYPRKPEAGPANTKGAALLGYVIWYGLRGENMKHRIDDWGLDPSDFREINLGFDAEVVSADNKQVHIRYNDKLDSLLYAREEDEPHDLLLAEMTTAIDKNIDSSSPVYSIFVRLKGHLDEDVSDTMRDLLDALNYSEMEELTELIPQFAEFMSEYVHITVLCNILKDGNLLRMAAKYGKYLADTLGSDEVREQAMQDALSAEEQQLLHKTEVIKKDFPLEEDELNRLTALLTGARFAY